jgi:DNA topoisomerase IA
MTIFVLCEKNTQQAKVFAKALFGNEAHNPDGFYTGTLNGELTVIGYLGGHVFEQLSPEEYNEKWDARKVSARELIANQPFIPEVWRLKPKTGKIGNQTVYQLIGKITKWGGWASEIYLATDPDREGTLLGQQALKELGLMDKVTKRVYARDMAESQIRKVFENPSPIEDDHLLFLAALERQRLDYAGGNSVYPLMKAENALKGLFGEGTGSIGRVKTGVAALIHQRNQTIDQWNPAAPENNKYGMAITTHDGLVLKSKKQAKVEAQAQKWVEEHQCPRVFVAAEDTKQEVNPPKYLQLSNILTWCKKNGIKDDAMPYLNNLALKGYITYPRTVVNVISATFRDENLAPHAEEVRNCLGISLDLPNKNSFKSPWVDDKKVKNAGHTANVFGEITPTPAIFAGFSLEEQKLYRFIAIRTLGPMFEKGIDAVRKYSSTIGEMEFTASARVITAMGWRDCPDLFSSKKGVETPDFIEGGEKESVFSVEHIKRNPPVRITKSNIYDIMEKEGLGTSSTQEIIIKEMMKFGQIKDNGKYFELTSKGTSLVSNQPLHTFETTRWLAGIMRDIQGLGDDGKVSSPGTALNEMVRRVTVWRDDLLMRLPKDFSTKDPTQKEIIPKEKILIHDQAGKAIEINKVFFGHEFTAEEAQKLAQGQEITFTGSNGKPVTGCLKWQTYSKHKFLGFMPNWDLEKYNSAKGLF